MDVHTLSVVIITLIFIDNYTGRCEPWILACAITRCGRIFADFVVCAAGRDSGPTLLARQIIPADFAVTNYLGREAVYSNRYTVSVDICKRVIPSFPITITSSNGLSRSFCLQWIDSRFLSDFSNFFRLFSTSSCAPNNSQSIHTHTHHTLSLALALPNSFCLSHGLRFILFAINKVKSDADYLHRKAQWKMTPLRSVWNRF